MMDFEAHMKALVKNEVIKLENVIKGRVELKCRILNSVAPTGKKKTITSYNAIRDVKRLIKW